MILIAAVPPISDRDRRLHQNLTLQLGLCELYRAQIESVFSDPKRAAEVQELVVKLVEMLPEDDAVSIVTLLGLFAFMAKEAGIEYVTMPGTADLRTGTIRTRPGNDPRKS
jgi:hypothetical protein